MVESGGTEGIVAMSTNIRRRIEGLEARSVPLVDVIPKAVRDAAVSAELQRLRGQAPGKPPAKTAGAGGLIS